MAKAYTPPVKKVGWGLAPSNAPTPDSQLAGQLKNTIQGNLDYLIKKDPRAAGGAIKGAPSWITDNPAVTSQIQNLMNRRNTTGKAVRGLEDYLGSQGYNAPDVQSGLQQYLTQDASLGKFLPGQYAAPTKADMLQAVQGSIPTAQSQATNNSLVQYAEMIRQIQLGAADSYEQGMSDKVANIKDPARQAQAQTAVSNYANLMRLQANNLAGNQFDNQSPNDPNSILSVLGAFNQGQKTNVNQLYGGAANAPGGSNYQGTATGGGQSAGLDDFAAQVLAGINPSG